MDLQFLRNRTVFVFALMRSLSSYGQDNKYDIGITVPCYIKTNVWGSSQVTQSMFGLTGLDAVLKIYGHTENSMSFIQSIGINTEKIVYKVAPGSKIYIDNAYLKINPSVTIPGKWKNIQYSLGIGVLWIMDNNTGAENSSNGVFYADVDSISHTLSYNSRKIIPFIALGLCYDITHRIKLQFSIEQTFLKYYEPNTEINYRINGIQNVMVINYEPTYIGVKCFYYLNHRHE